MFKRWEDYTELEKAQTIYSDEYKAVHGVRPRFTADWTLEQFDKAFDSLAEEAKLEAEWQREREAIAVKDFEAAIATTMETCNCDRETAWRYLKDAEGDDWYDDGYYEYNTGLPRGYLEKQGFEITPIGFFEEEEV